jgi:hypothetical protein
MDLSGNDSFDATAGQQDASGPSDTPQPVMVGVGIRVVPAGVVTVGGRKLMRATLVLSPVADTSSAKFGELVELKNWPAAVEAYLKKADISEIPLTGANAELAQLKFHLSVAQIASETERPAPNPAEAKSIKCYRALFHDYLERSSNDPKAAKPNFDKWSHSRSDDIGPANSTQGINYLWQQLMVPNGDGDWVSVAAALGAPASGTSQKAQVDKLQSGTAPDVVSAGRGEAALLLAIEHGNSLVKRLKKFRTTAMDERKDEINLAYFPADPYDPTRPTPSWMGGTATLIRLASADPAVVAIGNDQDKVFAKNRDLARTFADIERSKRTAKNRAELTAAYSALEACLADAEGSQSCLLQLANDDVEKLSADLDHALARHAEVTKEETEEQKAKRRMEALSERIEGARARLGGILKQPTLARLFNFAVDVYVPLNEFQSAYFASPAPSHVLDEGGGGPTSRIGYAFIAGELTDLQATRRVWTATKLRGGHEEVADIWPCARDEIDICTVHKADAPKRESLRKLLYQMDGLVNLRATAPASENYRFDIVTLDVLHATENRQTNASGSVSQGRDVLTNGSAGLALLDRSQQRHAITQLLKSDARIAAETGSPDLIVVDADDLTTGYRLDVGTQANANGPIHWRSLCNRTVSFSNDLPQLPGASSQKLEDIIDRVVINKTRRVDFDSASLILPARIVPKSSGVGETAFVEDIVGQWLGPPMGVDANSGRIPLAQSVALRVSQVYGLARPNWLPKNYPWSIPRLVFGGGYRVGVRTMLQGGVIRELNADTYTAFGANHGVLPPKSAGARRFLRHERIETPIVSTPLAALQRLYDKTPDGLRETSTAVTVRSRFDGKAIVPADSHSSSLRVFFPPPVAAIFADRHRSFDKVKTTAKFGNAEKWWSGPPDGLQNVDYDSEDTGGFPVWTKDFSSEGEVVAGVRPTNELATTPSGDSIFRPRTPIGRNKNRPQPYYPDPAASFMVFALRDKAGRRLPGVPLVVPLKSGTVLFPNVIPVALDVIAVRATTGTKPSHDRLLGLDAGPGAIPIRGSQAIAASTVGRARKPAQVYLDGTETISRDAKSARVAAWRVILALEPGESYDLDVWCVPTKEDLLNWFDVIESATLVASIKSSNELSCPDCTAFVKRIEDISPTDAAAMKAIIAKHADADVAMCTLEGKLVPKGAVLCIGEAVHEMMMQRITPELAACKKLSVAHALDKPLERPEPALSLRRVTSAEREEILSWKMQEPGDWIVCKEAAQYPTAESTDALLVGTISVDRTTTGFFEVVADGAGLVSGAFDVADQRKRSSDDLARGIWPIDPLTGKLKTAQQIYGFDVDREGRVTLPLERTRLLRVDDDVPDASSATPDRKRNILELQRRARAAKPQGGKEQQASAAKAPRTDPPAMIKDTRARIMKLSVSAGSRTATFFRDPRTGDIIYGGAATQGAEQDLPVILWSTKAPARVSPLTILPSFSLTQRLPAKNEPPVFSVERRVRLRIRIRRPWFSSGVKERLGIVLWPPELNLERIGAQNNSVARDYDLGPIEGLFQNPSFDMTGFSDLDLGRGGAFVTRWGADPTKGGNRPIGWLIPPTAFVDLKNAPIYSDGHKDCWNPLEANVPQKHPSRPVLVPRARMPIPVDKDASKPPAGAASKPADSPSPAYMEVALLTYEPLFDVDQENWFVDVEVNPMSVPEPFIRFGLVRYQPLAAPDLRVSEPVVEWAAVLPKRDVVVRQDQTDPRLIRVEVTGVGSHHSSNNREGEDISLLSAWRHRSIMKISVIQRLKNGEERVALLEEGDVARGTVPGLSQRAARTWIPELQQQWTQYLQQRRMIEEGDEKEQRVNAAKVREGDRKPLQRRNGAKDLEHHAIRPVPSGPAGAMQWCADFLLKMNPLLPDESGPSYSVFVEEVEAMKPATYRKEPFDSNDPKSADHEELAVSGPKFMARVEIMFKRNGSGSP